MLTCQSVTEIDGYPVLRKVFRHLARTPKKFTIWAETRRPGSVRFVLTYSSGEVVGTNAVRLRGDGTDNVDIPVRPGFEGGIKIVMIDEASGDQRAARAVHFGGLSWLGR